MLSLCIGIITDVSYAQIVTPFNSHGDTSPGVNTYEMARYGDFDIPLYTGAMSYSIPVFTYSDPDFKLPIVINYRCDGYKPATYSGELGLGWSLSVGGVITRSVKGVPDEGGFNDRDDPPVYGFYEAIQDGIFSDPHYHLVNVRQYGSDLGVYWPETENLNSFFDPFRDVPVYGYSGVGYETTPDIFHFSVGEISGDFSFKRDGSIVVYNTNLPYGEIDVEFSLNHNWGDYQYLDIVITTGEGTKYYFGGSVNTNEYSEHSNEYTVEFDNASSGDGNMCITAAKLRKIKAPNGREMIFHYSSTTFTSISSFESRHSHLASFNYHNGPSFNSQEDLGNVVSAQKQYYCPLDSITVDGKLLYTASYVSKAFDECASIYFTNNRFLSDAFYGDFPNMTPGKRLTEVSVYNRDGQLIEDVSLFHSFSQGGTPKMFLDSLSLLSLGKYKFDYYDRDSLPQQDTPCTDYWGYWNDIACYYYGLRRENVSLYNQFYNADMKMPSFQKTQKGALSHIHYPTGGYMSVEYEANDAGSLINYSMDTSPYYINNTDNFPIGGLRVKRKTNHAGDTFRSVAYSYTHSRTDSTSSGTLSQMPRYLIIVSFYYVRGFVTDCTLWSYALGVRSNMSSSNFIVYGNVTAHYDDGSSTQYSFHNNVDFYTPSNSPGYEILTETKHVFSVNDYYTNVNYDVSDNYDMYGVCAPVIEDRSCLRGKLYKEQRYDANGELRYEKMLDYSDITIDSSDYIWYNNVTNFIGSRTKYKTAQLLSTTERFYLENVNSKYDRYSFCNYNNYGQIKSTSAGHRVNNTSLDHTLMHFRYALGYNSYIAPGLPVTVAKTVYKNGVNYLIAAESYSYSTNGNPHPISITSYSFESPIVISDLSNTAVFTAMSQASCTEVSTFLYDNQFRLIRADLPGGAWRTYTWDGNNITSRTENGEYNTTLYEWKDLVGLTGVTSPTGTAEIYQYDARNRLWRTFDDSSKIISENMYHILNE